MKRRLRGVSRGWTVREVGKEKRKRGEKVAQEVR